MIYDIGCARLLLTTYPIIYHLFLTTEVSDEALLNNWLCINYKYKEKKNVVY